MMAVLVSIDIYHFSQTKASWWMINYMVTQVTQFFMINPLLRSYVGLAHRKICRNPIPFFPHIEDKFLLPSTYSLLHNQDAECFLYFHVIFFLFCFVFVNDFKVVSLASLLSSNCTLPYIRTDNPPSSFLYYRFLCSCMNETSVVVKTYCTQWIRFCMLRWFMAPYFCCVEIYSRRGMWPLTAFLLFSATSPVFLIGPSGCLSFLLMNRCKTGSLHLMLLQLIIEHHARNWHLFPINIILLVWPDISRC